ncbi:MAG: DUF2974 domain-containing protein, partial [Bacilli bacterium]|nr:DUF2974 domain-containing protein [Bacilli bacterium]
MTIYEYIDEYGVYSFKENEFNEVDATIFSYLSYAKLDKVFEEKRKVTIQEAGRMQLGYQNGEDDNIIAVKGANNLLKYIKDTKRYKNCILSHYKYIGNKETQFGAVTIEYDKNKLYISFEGTDELFSGWIEDFMLSYQCPTKAHEQAIKYLNKYLIFQKKEVILGGHSKGGNLALIAGMYANNYAKKRIKTIYGMDSPGLLKEQLESNEYNSIKEKYIHIIPNYSMVGILLKTEKDIVIKSKKKGILAHDIFNWEIQGNELIREELSILSKEIRKETDKWIDKYNEEDKYEFVKNLNDIILKSNVVDFLEIKKEHKKIINIITESKSMTNQTKTMLKELIGIMIKSYSDTKIEEIKTKIE